MSFMVDTETKRVCLEQIKAASVNFGERELVIWGTRERGAFIKELLEESGYSCSFFVSSRPKTDTFCGSPLRTPECLDVSKHYVFLATSSSEVKEYLHTHGFSETDGQDRLEVGYSYYSCAFMENMQFVGKGYMGKNQAVGFCCVSWPVLPEIPYSSADVPQEIVQRVFDYRDQWIAESRRFNSDRSEEGRVLTAPCVGCHWYQKKSWISDRGIHEVNLSVYPSPCQSKCFYCDPSIKGDTRFSDTLEVKAGYEALFGVLEYAKNNGLFSDKVRWSVATGEIAIHPYREQILKLVGKDSACFYTNAMKYDEEIAKKLSENPKNVIQVSIDSGTAETWNRVKGVNNFELVKENLFRYHAMCIHPNQIELKYIIFPGVNDSDADFYGAVELLKQLQITKMHFSCEARVEYRSEYRADLVRSAARFLALCEKNGILLESLWEYTPSECTEIQQNAKVLLADGVI